MEDAIMEEVTEVDVKREKLKKAGHLTKKRSHSDIANEGISIVEVTCILQGLDEEITLESLEVEELRVVLEVWKKHNKEDTSEIQSMTEEDMYDALTDAAQLIKPKELFPIEEENPDKDVDDAVEKIMGTVKGMQISNITTDADLRKYSHEQHVFFVYWTYLMIDDAAVPQLDDLFALPQEEIFKRLQQWRDKQKLKVSDITIDTSSDEESNSSKNDTSTRESTEKPKPSDNSSDPKVQKKPQSPKRPQTLKQKSIKTSKLGRSNKTPTPNKGKSPPIVSPSKSTQIRSHKYTLDEKLTDDQINSMSITELKQMYQKYSISAGSPIAFDIINKYSEEFLKKTIRAQRSRIIDLKKDNTATTRVGNLKRTGKYKNAPKKQSNLQHETVNSWRYTMNFQIPDDKAGTDALRNFLSDIFHEMCSYCEGLLLMPWAKTDNSDTIDDNENIPTTITKIQKYFDGARSSTGQYKQYCKV